MKRGDLVHVQWQDSLGCPQGWQLLEDVGSVVVAIESVGWLLRESRDSITLAPHLGRVSGEVNQGQGIMTIPKRCITKKTVISSSGLVLPE
jgi:hypothetical protein